MPNTGRPSRDCHLCRKRRVKCDLGRPGCQRCVKYGVECPGYRDQQELVFRDANPANSKKSKKRQNHDRASDGKDSPASQSPVSSQSSTPILNAGDDFIFVSSTYDEHQPSDSTNGNEQHVILTRNVNEHWTAHSIPIILNVYSTLEFICDTYQCTGSQGGPLVWAAHLFTRTYITNMRYPTAVHNDSKSETQRELGKYLGKTLSAVGEALKSPEGTRRDDVLATVWILANYELLIGSLNRTEPLSPWHLHTKGLYSILKSRGAALLHTDRGRTAFWPAYNMVQIQALVTNTECPPESDEWLEIIKNELYPGEGMTLHVSLYVAKITRIQYRIMNIIQERDFATASLHYPTLINDMTEAELEFDTFTLANSTMDHPLDLYMLNMYNSAVIKGNHTVQLLANFLTHYPPCPVSLDELRAQRVYCLQRIRDSAQRILDYVPYAIKPLTEGKDKSPKALFDAMKITWPLISVYVISSVVPEQRRAARSILGLIGKEFGIRQASNTIPEPMLLPPEARIPLESIQSV